MAGSAEVSPSLGDSLPGCTAPKDSTGPRDPHFLNCLDRSTVTTDTEILGILPLPHPNTSSLSHESGSL